VGRRRYGRRVVETSNEDKVLFPDPGLAKGDLIDYYERAAEHILPHLRERPLVLERYPDGIDAEGFYQKQVEAHFPDWIPRVRVRKGAEGGAEHQELAVCNGRAALAWLANQACVTLHPWLSRTDRPERPDLLVVDLDPPGAEFAPAREAAHRVRELLEELGLPSWAKLTGSSGVHVVVPLDRGEGFDAVRELAREAMELLARRHPETLTTEQRKAKRRGRVYLDVGRNARAQTAVAPYAVRPLPGAPVAVPVDWDELRSGDLDARSYTVSNVFRRLGQRRDPWTGMRRRARGLGPARRRLARLREDGDR